MSAETKNLFIYALGRKKMRRRNFVFVCFRLHGAMMTNRKLSLVSQGQLEAKLLHTNGIELSRTNGVS